MKFSSFPETHVYVNPHGALVIKQLLYPDDDQFVFLPKSIALTIAAEIQRLHLDGHLSDIEDGMGFDPEGDEDA